MKRNSIVFLQVIIVLIGIGAATLLLWEPQLEGVNANATNFQIYFQDPFLALVYAGSVPFFIALYQAFKVLGYVRENKTFSPKTVKLLRTIKYCSLTIIGFIVAEEIFLAFTHGDDDITGAIGLGVLISFGSIIIATAAGIFEQILQNAIDIKSENNLTV